LIRIGHKGAAALAPENTLRSIERAIEVGVDMVEIDVLTLNDGTLVLAHSNDLSEVSHGAASGTVTTQSLAELRRVAPELPTLDEALALLAGHRAGIFLDLKWHGYEREVVDTVRRHGLVPRTFVSSCFAGSMRLVGELEPEIRRGLTYPFDRNGVTQFRYLAPFVIGALVTLRRTLPRRIGRLLARADATVATLHYLVVSAEVVRRCHARGAAVYAWTVDDPRVYRRLAALGVDGIVTNDPRIFAANL
jgi:glycerophosphoryl diester phosphodiesterase